MKTVYQTPGVYREEVILKSPPELQTGVPGFVGFVKSESARRFNEPVLLNRSNEFDARFGAHLPDGSYLADGIRGFFSNGGARCYVAVTALNEGLEKALESLS